MRQNFNTLLQTIQHYKLFPANETVIVAVSGGADSLALLHWLTVHQQVLQIQLHVATLNHGIRPQAQQDITFVKDIAEQWNLSYTSATIDVPQIARTMGQGIEATARKERYQFLAETAHRVGAAHIATAHHADDQSETILMHILRGSGLQGLIGMQHTSPLPYDPDVWLVRPLLRIPRDAIEAYCTQHDLQPRTDLTNDDTTYRRNEIRHQILPRLRQINPQLDDALLRLSQIASSEDEYVTQTYQEYFKPYITFGATISANLEQVQTWHLAIQRRFLLDALSHFNTEPNFTQIEHALLTIAKGRVGAIAEFSGKLQLRIGYETIYLESPDAVQIDPTYLQLEAPLQVSLPGDVIIGQHRLILSFNPLPDADGRLHIPAATHITLRTRQAGDRFMPRGLNGHSQKIKKWLIDNKVPQPVRDRLPLVIVDNVIAAIMLPNMWRIAEPFAHNESSQRIVYAKVVKI